MGQEGGLYFWRTNLLRLLRTEPRFVDFPDNAVVTILTELPRPHLCVCAPAIGARHSEPLEQHIFWLACLFGATAPSWPGPLY